MSSYFSFINNLKVDKSDVYFFVVICLFLYLLYNQNNAKLPSSTKNKIKEGFYAGEIPAATTVPKDIKDAVSALYSADVEAIRNLSSLASKLTLSGSLTCPGGFTVLSDLTVSGNIIANDKFKVDKNGSIVLNYNNQAADDPTQIIDLGAGDLTREGNAGKIAYGGKWGSDCLNIVGKGITGGTRKIRIHDQIDTTTVNADVITNSNGDMRVTSKSGSTLYINNDKTGGDVYFNVGSQNSAVVVGGNGKLICDTLQCNNVRMGPWTIKGTPDNAYLLLKHDGGAAAAVSSTTGAICTNGTNGVHRMCVG